MGNKYQTLHLIYDLVKNDTKPSMTIFHPNEIISRQHFPWDEIVRHLNELKTEGHIAMNQTSPAIITITEKGFEFIANLRPVSFV